MMLLLIGTMLWSGSLDYTLRIWDLNTFTVAKVITKEAVACMVTQTVGSEQFVISGGLQGEIKKWTWTGDLAHSCNHANTIVTAMNILQHPKGGKTLSIYLF
jgi:WD40 repeat protein